MGAAYVSNHKRRLYRAKWFKGNILLFFAARKEKGRKAENVKLVFLTSGFAACVCFLTLKVPPNSINRIINNNVLLVETLTEFFSGYSAIISSLSEELMKELQNKAEI